MITRGIDTVTVPEVGRRGFADPEQPQFAIENNRVLVTFDREQLVGDVMRQAVGREAVHDFVLENSTLVATKDREQFVRLVETEIYSLHDGNFARYKVTPSEFSKWFANWSA